MNTNAIYNLNDIPLFTYGMIGVATLGLALITMNIENDSFAKDDGYEKIKSKKTGGNLFDIFSSKSSESKKEEQNGTLSEEPTKKTDSIFGNMFSKSSEEKDSIFTTSFAPKKEDSMLTLKSGGKYNKTKHNKKHSVYTRKR
jgi:hypothetical protein